VSFEHFDTLLAFVVILAGVSLLVTTLTQMISATLGLRGANLRWGIETLLVQLDPSLAAHARTITEKILHHPLISDSAFSGSSHGLTRRWKLASSIREDELVEILRMLARPTADATADQTPEPWLAALNRSLDRLDPKIADALVQAAPQIKKVLPDNDAQADRILAGLTAQGEQLIDDLRRWFDPMMDRVSQRFVMHTRIWTVVFAVLIAFALHLDAFKLLTQLSSDSDLRTRLLASADSLSKKAEQLQATPGSDVPATESAAMMQLTNAANDFRGILNDKLQIQLVPHPYPQPFYNYWTAGWTHFWGVAATAALLSLGAPFWFNVLKGMANLKPVVAKKENEESTADSDGQTSSRSSVESDEEVAIPLVGSRQ
jgi:hypothetical protein